MALVRSTPEDAMARSLAVRASEFIPYATLRPRSISFLPIARGCQAACPFCFSEASASAEQRQARLDSTTVGNWLRLAHERGAERAVITGGGEPTLLGDLALRSLVEACSGRFSKVVLITNGFALATADDPAESLRALREAGLSVLAVSRTADQPFRAISRRIPLGISRAFRKSSASTGPPRSSACFPSSRAASPKRPKARYETKTMMPRLSPQRFPQLGARTVVGNTHAAGSRRGPTAGRFSASFRASAR
jgi:Radical SAM superfamily/4Fe-4S single cluster domain